MSIWGHYMYGEEIEKIRDYEEESNSKICL